MNIITFMELFPLILIVRYFLHPLEYLRYLKGYKSVSGTSGLYYYAVAESRKLPVKYQRVSPGECKVNVSFNVSFMHSVSEEL